MLTDEDRKMLTDEDQKRITAEEMFRQEVRLALETAKQPKSGLWAWLNSAFALWLFSSVILAVIGFAWTEFYKDQTLRFANKEEVRKNSIEVSARLGALKQQVERSIDRVGTTSGEEQDRAALDLLQDVYFSFSDKPDAPTLTGFYIVSAHPEYQSQSLIQLIYALEYRSPSDQRADVQNRSSALKELFATAKTYQDSWAILARERSDDKTVKVFTDIQLIEFIDQTTKALQGDLVLAPWVAR